MRVSTDLFARRGLESATDGLRKQVMKVKKGGK